MNHLSDAYDGAGCKISDYLKQEEKKTCLGSASTVSGVSDLEAFCTCSASKAAEIWLQSDQGYNSSVAVQMTVQARQECRNVATGQQAASSAPSNASTSASKPSATPKPTPANAEPGSMVDDLKEDASKAIDKAADKIKKGLGGLFKKKSGMRI